ncbi:hypothetical protein FA95DRAFT_1611297 [Auriscalpium vulgare]|uniref:Uncharacterized protein n=1 Tax=Auriscalpium vulgare TaxID=40419 RepID=A0ACB8RAV5_9AGAM|nr:hypothetical protein FA95DRAFT_1611297 [Auriscalpium vulgare]
MQPVVPLDVQITVIEWVYRSSQHSDMDYTTLYACALVCRAWAPTAQALLFRRLPQFSPIGEGRLRQLVHSLRASPRLAAYIHSVCINIVSYSSKEHPSLLLLDHCPQVRSIIFLDQITRSTWTPAIQKRLCALPLNPVSLWLMGNIKFLPRIALLWPSVQVLKIYAWSNSHRTITDDGDPTPSTPMSLPVPRNVESLSIKTDHIAWVLVPEPEHDLAALRSLGFQSPGWSDRTWLAPLLASGVLPQLRSLNIAGHNPPPHVMCQLTQLRSLTFTLASADWEVVLPPTLRHLGYYAARTDQEHVGPLVDAVRAAQELRVLAMLSDAPERRRASFADVCRERGIVLAFFEDATPASRPEDVDWI